MYMLKPKIGICTAILEGFNLDEDDSFAYQADLIEASKKLGFEVVAATSLIASLQQARQAARLFNDRDVDAFVLLFGTFTDDKKVMPLLQDIDKPLIMWATDYNAYNVSITGSQNVIPVAYELGLDYHYIYGRFDDRTALEDYRRFVRACAVKNRLKQSNIGYVGGHPSIMTSLGIDQLAVKQTFDVNLIDFGNEHIVLAREKIAPDRAKREWNTFKQLAAKVETSEQNGLEAAATHLCILDMVKKHGLHAVSINCFPHFKGKVCLSIAKLNHMGIPAACEGDLNATIMMYILHLLSGRAVSNGDQMKVLKLDTPQNSLMFSHCGAGAFSLAKDQKEVTIHDDYETGKGAAVFFPQRIPGQVTVTNLMGTSYGYKMFMARGKALDSDLMDHYQGNPINIAFPFNIRELLARVAQGGFGHHWNIGYGDHMQELIHLCNLNGIDYTTMDAVEWRPR